MRKIIIQLFLDFFKKEEMAPPSLFPPSLAPAGTPGVPLSLQAGAKQAALSRYAAPYLASPIAIQAINQLINELQGGTGAISTLGSNRSTTALQDPRDIYFNSWMSLLTGLRPNEISPVDRLRNIAYSGVARAAEENLRSARRQTDLERARR